MAHYSKVLIVDYGSQYTQLIARRVREAGVYSEILPCTATDQQIRDAAPSAVILSGGPDDVGAPDAPVLSPAILELGVPVLGICYGMQLLAHALGGTLANAQDREYGATRLSIDGKCALWKNLTGNKEFTVWMSHGNHVTSPPAGFITTASTPSLAVAAMANESKQIYALQFHPEVHHTEYGNDILQTFLLI